MIAGIKIELHELDERIPRVKHKQKKTQIIGGNFVQQFREIFAEAIVLRCFLLCSPQKRVKFNNCEREHNEYDKKN